MKTFFIANNNIGDTGLSGGDRIFIELARRWKERMDLSFVATEEAVTVCKREGLGDIKFFQTSGKIDQNDVFSLKAIFFNFFKKLTRGVYFILKNKNLFKDADCVYSVSDFYPDAVPALMVKWMYPRVFWIAGFFLFAPAPLCKDSPYKGKNFFRGFLYWISQKPVYWLVNRFADMVFVTSEPDQKKFVRKTGGFSSVIVVKGGVDLKASSDYLKSPDFILSEEKTYDACFVGRFHLQKGVLLLVDIWREVAKSRPEAKLAMIGNGPLESEVKNKIREYNLTDHIKLFGFLDGGEKFEIFKKSRIVLHPATFDSGGMAAAEAMAWGLPGVGFDLESLKIYYARGMVKVKQQDNLKFAQEILRLLEDKAHYDRMSQEARDFIVEEWSWDKRADFIYERLMENVKRG